MEYSFAYNSDLNAVIATVEGMADQVSIVELVQDLIKQLNHYPKANYLVDLSKTRGLDFSSQDMESVVDIYRHSADTWQGRKSANIVSGDLEYGLLRMWMSLVEDAVDMDARLFRDLDSGMAWLAEKT